MSGAPPGTEEGESESAPVWHAGHAAQRLLGPTLAFYAVVAAFCGALLVPGVSEVLGVSAAQGIAATAGAAAVSTIAWLLYRRTGVTRSYLIADTAESYALGAMYGYLIYTAGPSRSFFWLIYLTHVPILAMSGAVAYNHALVLLVPGALAVIRGVGGDWAGGALSVVVGGFGHLIYSVLARVTDDLEATRQREAKLKQQLVALSISQERGRIAQDLHDSVGAHLAGLVWRVRTLASRVNGPVQGDLAGVEARIVETIRELREVVVSLRPLPDTWSGMIGLLRERCEELSGDCALVFSSDETTTVESHPVYREVPLVVFELVRNAALHAHASRIEIGVRLERNGRDNGAPGDRPYHPQLKLCVADDGRGFGTTDASRSDGGLRNVERRVAELGGSVSVSSGGTGTRFHVVLPLGVR